MDNRIQKWLVDIQQSITEIDNYFTTFPRDFAAYKENPVLKRAIERNLEIIGEAVGRILKQDPNFQIENSKRIIGLRNQIIHSYDNISDENIWAIISKHIPKLKIEIDNLLRKE